MGEYEARSDYQAPDMMPPRFERALGILHGVVWLLRGLDPDLKR